MLARAAARSSSAVASRLVRATATTTAIPCSLAGAGIRSLSTAAAKKTATAATATTGGQQLANMTAANPHVDVVNYHHKNRTWTLNHVDYFSKALAIGFTENGLQRGDVVLSWLPAHFSEQASTVFCSSSSLLTEQEKTDCLLAVYTV
jgi:hypothetical protein